MNAFDQRRRKAPRDRAFRRVVRDRFVTSYCWLLAVNLICSVGFLWVDIYGLLSRGGPEELAPALGGLLLPAFIAASSIGLAAVIAGLVRLRNIKARPDLPGRLLCRVGIIVSAALAALLLLLWMLFRTLG